MFAQCIQQASNDNKYKVTSAPDTAGKVPKKKYNDLYHHILKAIASDFKVEIGNKGVQQTMELDHTPNLMMVPNNSPAHCTCSKKLSVFWQDNKQLNLSMNLFLDLALVTKTSENQILEGQGMLPSKNI